MEEKNNTYSKIEDQLREQADVQQFEYDPADWRALEKMLDDDRSKKGFGYRNGIALLALMILFGIIGYGFYDYGLFSRDNQTISLEESNINVKKSSVENSEITSLTETSDNELQSSYHDESTTGENDVRLGSTQNQITSLSLSFDKKSILLKGSAEGSLKAVDITSDISNNTRRNIGFSSQNDGFSSYSGIDNTLTNTTQYEAGRGQFIALDNTNSQLEQLYLLDRLSINSLENDLSFNEKMPSFADIEIVKDELFPLFFLGGNVGLESSKTGLTEMSKVDVNAGVQIGLNFNEKWRLVMGANYVIDRYNAQGEEYKITAKFRDQWGVPDHVEAHCSMLNAHVGLVYHFNSIKESGFSLNVRSVSNFMLDEKYDYFYTDAVKNWSGHWVGAHNTLFSAIEIGAGYNMAMPNGTAVSLNSYISLPTRGIGHGDIMLNSYGLRLGYGLNK